MVRTSKFWRKSVALIAIFALSINLCVATSVTWNGSSGDNWSTAANWTGTGLAPTSSDAPLFTNIDSPGISILDGTGDWTVNGLLVKNPDGSTIVSNITHTLNLNGNRLTVTGELSVASYGPSTLSRGVVTWVVTNGTLQIGSASGNKNLTVARASGNQMCVGEFIMEHGSTLDAYLGTVTIGREAGGKGILDLRKLTTLKRGAETGVFRAENLDVGYGGAGQKERYNNEILFGASLTSVEVTSSLRIADGQKTSAWIGKCGIEGTAVMPDNVDIKFGVDAGNRAGVTIGNGSYWGVKGHLIAGSGGIFTGYLSNLTVGKKGAGGSETTTGRLDLRNMTSGTLDVSGTTIIGESYDASKLGYGYVHLPSGTATFSNLTIGTSWGFGLLDLYGTDVTVNNALTVNATGSNIVRVATSGGSLTLGPTATLNVLGKLHIIFQVNPPEDGVRNGLKMPGDQRTVLTALNSAGKLTWDTSALATATAQIYYEAPYTYVGVRETWALTVIPHNRTIEVKSGVPTSLVFDIDDLDATPDDQGVTSREITHPDDLTPSDPHKVTLPAITMTTGAPSTNINITVTLYKDAEQASADAVVTVLPVPTGTSSALTWSGAAGTLLMPQHEWLWGQNWNGAVPPNATTPATLTFGNTGIGTNVLDQSYSVGGLNILNDTGTHTFDLNGKTLTINSGALQVGNNNFTTKTVFTNGTLSLAGANIILNSQGGAWSQLTAQNVVLDGNLGTLRLGDAVEKTSTGCGDLDLQDATFAGGLLSVANLEVGYAVFRDNLTYPRGNLLVSANTGLQRIVVTNAFRISDGHRVGRSRFGDPSNSYELPPNVEIEIGVEAASRGLLRIGTSLYGGDQNGQADGYLAASSGGTLTAWLNECTVGQGGIGTVNLTNMTSVAIDTTSLQLAITSFIANSGNGMILLPTGSLFVGTLKSGINGAGLLDLYGTDATVTNSLTLGAGGRINVRPGVSNGGLTMTASATLALDAASKIHLIYNEETTQYGLLWEGEHETDLTDYVAGGQIVIEGDYSHKVVVYTFRKNTYIGVPPPSGTTMVIR